MPTVLWILLFHLFEDRSEIFNRNYSKKFLYWLFIWTARVSFGLFWGDPNWRSRGESLGEHCTQQSPHILWLLLSILLDWRQAEKNAQSMSKQSLYDAGIKNRWDTLIAEYLQVTYKLVEQCDSNDLSFKSFVPQFPWGKWASFHHLESVGKIHVLKTGRISGFRSIGMVMLMQEYRQLQ